MGSQRNMLDLFFLYHCDMSERPTFLAVDWALIPEKSLFDLALEMNSSLPLLDDQIVLDDKRRPHITVMMVIVEKGRVEQLKSVLGDFPLPESLQLSGRVSVEGEKRIHQYLEIQKEELFEYHMRCREVCRGYHVQEEAQFAEEVGDSTRTYVRNFQKFDGDAYWPHITLGYGDCNISVLPRSFKATPGLFHLGDHCTCLEEI